MLFGMLPSDSVRQCLTGQYRTMGVNTRAWRRRRMHRDAKKPAVLLKPHQAVIKLMADD